jgi:acyl-CoA thioester hydrolase
MAFETTLHVSWNHLDANGHMANTAYLDMAVDVRFLYFTSCGFSPAEFVASGIGPVVRRDEVDYFRELRMLQPVRVSLLLAGLSDDASRFRIVNEFRREDGELCARLTSQGGWLDIRARKLVVPPEKLKGALLGLDRTETYQQLDSSIKR